MWSSENLGKQKIDLNLPKVQVMWCLLPFFPLAVSQEAAAAVGVRGRV